MKKLNLLLAGSLALLGLNASAQKILWTEDFEAGTEFFTDSARVEAEYEANPQPGINYIDGLDYYIGRTNGNGTWDVSTYDHPGEYLHVDTAFILYPGLSPVNDPAKRIDKVEVINDASGKHAKALKDLGGIGGENFMQYTSGPSTYGFNQWGGAPGVTNDYEANVFVRGLPIEDNTSYRVLYYMNIHDASSTGDSAQVDLRVMRGWYNSELAFSMDGKQGSQFTQVVKATDEGFEPDTWQRYSYMTYYTNDSIANKAVHANGYWWVDEWARILWEKRDQFSVEQQELFAKKDSDTQPLDSVKTSKWGWIVQPDTYFLRFSFQGPNAVYQVDDVTLYQSWIGAADYYGDMLRVNFGYQTNLVDIANSNGIGQFSVPAFTEDDEPIYNITAWDSFMEEETEVEVYAAEFHNDGYLYMWVDADFEDLDDVKFAFYNSRLPEEYQLKYTGSMYPKSNDAAWVEAGKLVPDFEGETVLPRAFSAVPIELLPPKVSSVDPEVNSFGLKADVKEIVVNFNKPVFAQGTAGVKAAIILGTEGQLDLTCNNYADDTHCAVSFTMPAKATLDGDLNIRVFNAKALDEETMKVAEGAEAGDPFDFVLSYGEPTIDVPGSQAQICYDTLCVSYNNAYSKQESCEADLEKFGGAAYEEFKALVALYEPEAFLAANTAPSAYFNAVKTLDDAAKAIQTRIDQITSFNTTVASVAAYLADNEELFGDYAEFKALAEAYATATALDLTTLSNEEVSAALEALNGAYSTCKVVTTTVTVKTRQIKALAALNEKLGVQLDETTAANVATVITDNQDLARILKLYAKKAIYENPSVIDSLDVTGMIGNYSLYATGHLDVDVVQEFYQYSQYNRYHIVNNKPLTTVLPCWTISSATGSVMCGYTDAHGYEGGGYVEGDNAIEGAVWSDWTSQYTFTQNVTDLPNGIFTLGLGFGGGEDNIANQYMTANGDTVAAASVQDATPVALNVTVDADTMFIKVNHQGCNAWSRTDEFTLYMIAPLEGFDYAAAAAEVAEELNQAITVVEKPEIEGDAQYFNINGMEMKEGNGLMIKVQGGKATKIFR